MLIPHSHADRLAAQAAKRRRLLAWLRSEIWTSHDLAGDVMGLRDRRAIQTTLASMQRDGLVVVESIKIPFGNLKIVGVTMDGQGAAATGEKEINPRAFEKGRVGLTVIEHTLDLQRLKLACLRAGWKNWTRPDAEKWGKNHRPDALAVTPDGVRVAVECERTLKTAKRYHTVASNHATSLKQGAFQHVVYASPEPEKARNVARLLLGLKPLHVGGEKVLAPPIIEKNFSFVTYENLPSIKIKP